MIIYKLLCVLFESVVPGAGKMIMGHYCVNLFQKDQSFLSWQKSSISSDICDITLYVILRNESKVVSCCKNVMQITSKLAQWILTNLKISMPRTRLFCNSSLDLSNILGCPPLFYQTQAWVEIKIISANNLSILMPQNDRLRLAINWNTRTCLVIK